MNTKVQNSDSDFLNTPGNEHRDNPEENEDDPGNEQQDDEEQEQNPFGWMAMVDAVAEVTRQPFSEIWSMGIYEFFNYFSYALYKSHKREEEINKFKRQY